MAIDLIGADAPAYEDALYRVHTSNAEWKGMGGVFDRAGRDADVAKLLAVATTGWRGIAVDGAPLECTNENAASIYLRFRWLRDQVDAFISNRANFAPKALSEAA